MAICAHIRYNLNKMHLSQTKIEEIEAKASDVLSSAYDGGKISFPVDLGRVAQRNGLTLKQATFSDTDALGKFDRTQKTIWVAEGEYLPRASFTIAHEIGHYVLHKNDTEVFWRLDTINLEQQKPEEETEANWFAASLLMPRNHILRYWSQTHDRSLLAKIFGVSESAMLYRLKSLSLL